MKPRAIICDVYRTILDILPPPENAEGRWKELYGSVFGGVITMSFADFRHRCHEEVGRVHGEARRRGVAFPEVQWPRIVATVLPGFDALDHGRQLDFLLAEQALSRGLGLLPGAAETLSEWSGRGLPLGIASNAQAYTLPELAAALGPAGVGPGIFAPDLTVWSWQLGFSKPDPCFFQTLVSRLAARGIASGEALMVGDRVDNDIRPARAAGLMTWHLHPQGDGGWEALRRQSGHG
jgi:FMN phosphatase YigB (HAD superfamily)